MLSALFRHDLNRVVCRVDCVRPARNRGRRHRNVHCPDALGDESSELERYRSRARSRSSRRRCGRRGFSPAKHSDWTIETYTDGPAGCLQLPPVASRHVPARHDRPGLQHAYRSRPRTAGGREYDTGYKAAACTGADIASRRIPAAPCRDRVTRNRRRD